MCENLTCLTFLCCVLSCSPKSTDHRRPVPFTVFFSLPLQPPISCFHLTFSPQTLFVRFFLVLHQYFPKL